MKQHPDEMLGRYRLRDTRQIRKYFEANLDEFETALTEYRAWKESLTGDMEACESCREVLFRRARAAGGNPYDWRCVLACASRRRDLGLPCPPWWAEADRL